MKRKIIIILAIVAVCILIASPVFAKEKVKVKITDGDFVLNNKGYIVIKLVDKDGREIRFDGKEAIAKGIVSELMGYERD